MKACALRYHLGYRNRIMVLGNRSIHKDGGTPKAREAQRDGTLRVSWLFPPWILNQFPPSDGEKESRTRT
jgi:hypothetical protein